jgi:hypothetical protein
VIRAKVLFDDVLGSAVLPYSILELSQLLISLSFGLEALDMKIDLAQVQLAQSLLLCLVGWVLRHRLVQLGRQAHDALIA